MERVNKKQPKTYCDDENKNELIALFKKRSHDARIYAYILIIVIYILIFSCLLLIYNDFYLNTIKNYFLQLDYINLGLRITAITVLFVLVKIMLTSYHNFWSMARFYDARADALIMLGNHFNISEYIKLCNILSIPYYIWGKKVDIPTNVFSSNKKNSSE